MAPPRERLLGSWGGWPTLATLVLLVAVAAVCSLARFALPNAPVPANDPTTSAHSAMPATYSYPSPRRTARRDARRRLDEDASTDDVDAGPSPPDDFSSYSCGDILTRTTPTDVPSRCAYARTCNEGDGLLLPFVFCDAPPNDPAYPYRMCAYLSPLLLLWLILLFRLLGSTAEDYFAPSPEMLSRRLGLPPRFAGASLLALGNGAPDISATINAIASDPTNGYDLSLGALTGGGMFVGTVVAGSTIIAAQGVPCRGALVRDVLAYVAGIGLVMLFLRSGKVVGTWTIIAFFAFYGTYAASVLAADVYHRAVVVPRARRREERRALARQAEVANERSASERDALLRASEAASDVTSTSGSATWGDISLESQRNMLSTMSVRTDLTASSRGSQRRRSRRESSERSISSSSGNGRAGFAGRFLGSLSNYAMKSTRLLDEPPVVLHGPGGILSDLSHHHHRCDPGEDGLPSGPLATAEEDEPTELGGGEYEQIGGSLHSGHGGSLWKENTRDLRAHWHGLWHDTFYEESTNLAERFFLAVELPFTIARKLSVPVPCEGYYCRPVTAFSVALSPVWIGAYAFKYGTNLFLYKGVPVVAILCVPSCLAGACIWLYADRKEMSVTAAGPLALYGFVMAASWIDFVGDQLVSLLEFLGVILHIPSPVMGLTVLAWGNSMGDLAADVALAKKGMANMAMTACFASPLFNMLIGLGGGFLALRSDPSRTGTAVSLSPAVITGFFFLLCNCIMVLVCGRLLQGGKIPVEYGYFMFGIYACYIVASIVVQLMKVHR